MRHSLLLLSEFYLRCKSVALHLHAEPHEAIYFHPAFSLIVGMAGVLAIDGLACFPSPPQDLPFAHRSGTHHIDFHLPSPDWFQTKHGFL